MIHAAQEIRTRENIAGKALLKYGFYGNRNFLLISFGHAGWGKQRAGACMAIPLGGISLAF
jgi:hypothetical protein